MLEAGDGGGAEAKAQQLNDLSNQFYTLIPHRLVAPPSHPHRRLIASPSDRTLIPHSFGTADMRMPDPTAACPIRRQRSALLDTVEVVMKKVEMIKKLLDLEATVTLLGDGAPAEGGGPEPKKKQKAAAAPAPVAVVDEHYAKLRCSLVPVDPASETFKQLERYVLAGRDPKVGAALGRCV